MYHIWFITSGSRFDTVTEVQLHKASYIHETAVSQTTAISLSSTIHHNRAVKAEIPYTALVRDYSHQY